MAKPKIPDRSAEPAVQESLDPDKSSTASNSDDVEPGAEAEARDDEGNAVEVHPSGKGAPKRPRPDSDAGSQ